MSTELDRPRKTGEAYFEDVKNKALEKNMSLTEEQNHLDLKSKETMQKCIDISKVVMIKTFQITSVINVEYFKLLSKTKDSSERMSLIVFYVLVVGSISLIPVMLGFYIGIVCLLFGAVTLAANIYKKKKFEEEKESNLIQVENEKISIIDKRSELRTENSIKVQEYISFLEDENELELEGYKLLFESNDLDDIDFSVIEKHLKDELEFVTDFFVDNEKESIVFVTDFDDHFEEAKKIISNLKFYRQSTLIKNFIKINKKFSKVPDINQVKHLVLLEKSEIEERYNKVCSGDISHILYSDGFVMYDPENYYKNLYYDYMNISPPEEEKEFSENQKDEEIEDFEM